MFNYVLLKKFNSLRLTTVHKDKIFSLQDKIIINYLIVNKGVPYKEAAYLVVKSEQAVKPFILSIIIEIFTLFDNKDYGLDQNSLFITMVLTAIATYYITIFLNTLLMGKNYSLGRFIPYEWRKTVISDFNNISYYEFWKKSNKEQTTIYEKAIIRATRRMESFEKYKEEMINNNLWEIMDVEDKEQINNNISNAKTQIENYKKGYELSKLLRY
jgi:hypothetical protein